MPAGSAASFTALAGCAPLEPRQVRGRAGCATVIVGQSGPRSQEKEEEGQNPTAGHSRDGLAQQRLVGG